MRKNKKMKHGRKMATFLLISFFVIFHLVIMTNFAHSQIEIDVISAPDSSVDDESIAAYIVRIYWFAVGAAGVVAVAIIVGGAIYYMTSSGSPDKQSEAKNYITSALWGVALLLGSFLILNTVNPQITSLDIFENDLPTCGGSSGERPGIDCLPGVPIALPACGNVENPQEGVNCLPECSSEQRACGIGEQEGDTKLSNTPCTRCAPPLVRVPEGLACSNACFFDPDKEGSLAACDFDDPSAVCTAVDKSTAACSGGSRFTCVCQNCSPIAGNIPIKRDNTCLSSTLGRCFLQEATIDKIERVFGDDFIRDSFGENKWRITEAFPPTAVHASQTHYNGKAFDMAPAEGYGCNRVIDIARKFAEQNFFVVLIEGPVGSCSPLVPDTEGSIPGVPGVKRSVNNTPFHIHVSDF